MSVNVDEANITRLAEAVQAGDAARVRAMLSARPELIGMDMSGGDERRALHYAVLRRDAAMVKLLMEAGADARKGVYPHRDATSAAALARDRGYDDIVAVIEDEERHRRAEMSCPNATITPVQEQINRAILDGDNATAISLLKADGSLIQACDREGRSPLHLAAAFNEEMTAWLLDRRANARKEDLRGLTPLDYAALTADPRNEQAKRFPAIAKLLLSRGAEVTIRAAVALADAPRIRELLSVNPAILREIHPTRGGLLSIAVNHGHLEIVRLLLDLGADVDERIMLHELEEPTLSWGGPLWYAALAGDLAIVELLLDRGADPNANVYASGWPLRNAWRHEDNSVKRLLLARGAKPQPYMVAETHDVAEARRLLEHGPTEELASELAWAAADSGCPDIVALALPHLSWPAGDSRWHWVLMQPMRGVGDQPSHEGHFECLALLLRHGVDPNVTSKGEAALHFTAAWHGDLSGAERARFAAMLLDYGARLDLRDDLLKSTPLAWACRWGRQEMVELMLERGAPVDEPDAEPWSTPMAWAEKMEHETVLALLRSHTGSV